MKNMLNALKKRKFEVLGSMMMVAAVVVPFLTFASSRDSIYVDASAKGQANGSASHPYKTISEALDHANDRTDVHVANGKYVENIDIPSGVRVFGEDADGVVIHADSSHKPAVTMKSSSRINKVTIENGDEGILVKKNAKVSIIEVVIKDNDGDGIKIEKGDVDKDRPVSITDSTIFDNGRSGIYSEKRRVVLINNEITHNHTDGVDFAAGSSAWIEKNDIRANKTGVKITLDGSQIFTKNNAIRNNNEGIEINAHGNSGRVDIKDAKITGNKEYGIERVQRAGSQNVWSGVTVQKDTKFEINKLGNISAVLFVK